jgi:PhnB protein
VASCRTDSPSSSTRGQPCDFDPIQEYGDSMSSTGLPRQETSVTASGTSAVNPIPEHLHTVTPRLVVRDGAAAIDFYRRAFGAKELGDQFTGPNAELIHAEIRIGDSVVMITEDAVDGPVRSPDRLGGMVSCVMSLYWDNVDAAWERAVSAGAEVIYPLEDQFYGERGGRLRDPFGQQWMMSQHIEDVSPEEISRRAAALFGK